MNAVYKFRMVSPCKSILRSSHFQKILVPTFKTASSLSVLQKSNCKCYQQKKHFSVSHKTLKENEIPTSFSRYELFSEETAPVILDVEEERQKITHDERDIDVFEGINLAWGVGGAFDVSEIVELLKREKGENICVIKIPQEYYYADYMVIVNGKSKRHMVAMSDFIRKIYKLKLNQNGQMPKQEGKNSNIWMALDLGNIILHIFSREGREVYDLETLWSVGKEFDMLSQKKNTTDDISVDYVKILASLSPNS